MTWKLVIFTFGLLCSLNYGACEYSSRNFHSLEQMKYELFADDDGEYDSPIITVGEESACTLNVTWPEVDEATEYVVSWKEADSPSDILFSEHTETPKYTIEDLSPSTAYEVFVTASFDDGSKTQSEPKNDTTLAGEPPGIKSVEVSDETSTRIVLKYSAAESKCAFLFRITWEAYVYWDPDRTSQGGDVTEETQYILSNLIPDSNYTIGVNTFTSDGIEGNNKSTTSETLEGEPGPPTDLTAVAKSKSEIDVSWSDPPDPNGVLGPYTLNWMLSAPGQDGTSNSTNDTSAEISNLLACGNYYISVQASTEIGEGQPATTNVTTDPEAPPPVTDLSAKKVDSRSAELSWNAPDTLCAIDNYYLNGTGDVLWGNMETDMVQYDDIEGTAISYKVENLTPYTFYKLVLTPQTEGGIGNESIVEFITNEDVPEPPLNLSIVPDSIKTKSLQISWVAPTVTNGDLTEFNVRYGGQMLSLDYSESQELYVVELTGLKKNTKYNITVTALTKAGESQPAMTKSTTENNTAVVVLGILIPCILIAGLLAVAFIYKDDIRHKMNASKATNPSGDYEELTELNVAPIPLTQLRAYVTKLETGNTLASEFATIGAKSYRGTTSEGDRPQNQEKNRYANILPYDVTRVSLKGRQARYINANYITSSRNSKFFIAAQGPKDTTLEDFWEMVWHDNVDVIVMLTLCNEGGKDKCSQYWPRPLGYGTDIGSFSINNINEETTTLLTLRMLEVTSKRDNTRRLIRHYQYMAWPDFGAPASPEDLLNVMSNVKRNLAPTRNDRNKLLVHCSAGVGRTGTFIALWNLIEQIEHGSDSVSITREVLSLRKQRMIMVQSKEQYLYLYKCVVEYYENKSRWHIKMGDSPSTSAYESGTAVYNNPSFDSGQEFQGNLI